jgi:hypothetical protein
MKVRCVLRKTAIGIAAATLLATASLSTSGTASAIPSNLDDVVRIITQQAKRFNGKPVQDVVTRSRVALRPVAEKESDVFGKVLDAACTANDIWENRSAIAAFIWIDQQYPPFVASMVRDQMRELRDMEDKESFGSIAVEVICSG